MCLLLTFLSFLLIRMYFRDFYSKSKGSLSLFPRTAAMAPMVMFLVDLILVAFQKNLLWRVSSSEGRDCPIVKVTREALYRNQVTRETLNRN